MCALARLTIYIVQEYPYLLANLKDRWQERFAYQRPAAPGGQTFTLLTNNLFKYGRTL